ASRFFFGITQIRPADVASKERVSGKQAHRLALFLHKKAYTVRRMPGCLKGYNLQRPDADHIMIMNRHALIFSRSQMRHINLCASSQREFHVARDEIRVRMGFQNGDDPEVFPRGNLEIIIELPFGIDNRRLTSRAYQVGRVRQSFNIETFLEHVGPAHLTSPASLSIRKRSVEQSLSVMV